MIEKSSNSIGMSVLIFLIFLVMKLAGIGQVATWSWWWVTSPLWIGAGLIILIIIVATTIIPKSWWRK
jgi:hypothetical protein